jgi:hypothetical protein
MAPETRSQKTKAPGQTGAVLAMADLSSALFLPIIIIIWTDFARPEPKAKISEPVDHLPQEEQGRWERILEVERLNSAFSLRERHARSTLRQSNPVKGAISVPFVQVFLYA